ncbi:MAG: hypothetical protein RBT62_11395 [Spirochaetia bacterium]|nr:hypothetical protein [Spirochaetia bacterium]
MGGRNDDEAAALLEELRPELLRMLANKPAFGTIGVTLTFHEGTVSKIGVSAEVLRKPKGGRV